MSNTKDLLHDDHFIGRADDLYNLVHNLTSGLHSLLMGDRGVGKSRLMKEAYGVISGDIKKIDFSSSSKYNRRQQSSMRINYDKHLCIYIYKAKPASILYKSLLKELFNEELLYIKDIPEDSDIFDMSFNDLKREHLKGGNSTYSRVIVDTLRHNESKNIILFFDDLTRMSPSYKAFFESIMLHSTICTGVNRIKNKLYLKKIWSSFIVKEIEPLSKHQASLLIDYFYSNYDIRVIDRADLKKEILRAAGGNPFYIKNFLWRSYSDDHSADDLIYSTRDSDENNFLNLGPFYAIFLMLTSLMKIFSIGTSSRSFYIYTSALGFIGYMIFRLFRSFFKFRPQKKLIKRKG